MNSEKIVLTNGGSIQARVSKFKDAEENKTEVV
jgi:hypothetical protein